MRFLSICSGIEAASVAFEPLGWKAGAFSEIDPAACDLLAHHYPDVPNIGDMTAPDFIERAQACGPFDMVCGGTPCQAFSVAGRREGLGDGRGNLTLGFVEICNGIDPAWIIWENVPGVLSDKTNAFGCFLAGLAGTDAPLVLPAGQRWTDAGMVAGPKRQVAWRILDAQYFGVAQRRRRVFVVAGRAGTGADPSQILFEPESVRRHTPPGREEGQEVAGTLGGGSQKRGWCDDLDRAGAFVPVPPLTGNPYGDHESREGPLVPSWWDGGDLAETRNVESLGKQQAMPEKGRFAAVLEPVAFTQNQAGDLLSGDVCPAMGTNSNATGRNTPKVMAFTERADCLYAAYGTKWNGNAAAENGSLFAATNMAVRRLTPRECERLQGFPDDYTLVPRKNGKLMADGPRYKMLGNSWAVPVVRWIGERINKAKEVPCLTP